ncbi:MAG: YncE family protein [Candidatus Hodarchaeota archaeon]
MKKLKLKQRWTHSSKSTVYFCVFGNIMKNPQNELITCDYDENLSAYSVSGAEVFNMRFSSSIIYFFITRFSDDGRRLLISIDLDGLVGVFSLDSEEIWKVSLGDNPVGAALCDFTGNGKNEIIVATENNSVFIINQDGIVTSEIETPVKIKDITSIDVQSSGSGEIVILGQDGSFFKCSSLGLVEPLPFENETGINQLRAINLLDKQYLLMYDYEDCISIMDLNGEVLYMTDKFKKEISTIGAGRFFKEKIDDIAICFEDGTISVFKIDLEPGERRELETGKRIPKGDEELSPNQHPVLITHCGACGVELPRDVQEKMREGKICYCKFCGIDLNDFMK